MDDESFYFCCHAASTRLDDPGGRDASSLLRTDAAVTLGALNIGEPTSVELPSNRIVFINACESWKMSPTFCDGFSPYLMAKGARGVVRTECETPALFAVVNPFGPLYAVHCGGDAPIHPALKV